SMGVYVFSRKVLLDMLARDDSKDFGREIIPAALGQFRVQSHLFDGYWADVGTVDSFYEANIMLTRPGAPFKFYDPRRPIYTHRRRRAAGQRRPRSGIRRRRLLHSGRRHRRPEGWRDQTRDEGLGSRGRINVYRQAAGVGWGGRAAGRRHAAVT